MTRKRTIDAIEDISKTEKDVESSKEKEVNDNANGPRDSDAPAKGKRRKTEKKSATQAVEGDCTICLENYKNDYAVLQCKHTFCFTCIKEWSDTENSCPLCKMRFKHIDRYNVAAAAPGTKPKKERVKIGQKDQRDTYQRQAIQNALSNVTGAPQLFAPPPGLPFGLWGQHFMMAYAQHSGFFGLNDDDDDEDDEDYVDEDFGVDMDDDGAFMDDDDDEDGESAHRYHDEFTELIYRRNFGEDGHYHYSVRYPPLGPLSHHLFPRTPTTGPGTTSNDPINLADDDDDDEEATPAVTVIGSRSSTTRPSSSLPSSSVSSVTRASVDMRPPALQRLPRSRRGSASSAVIDLTDEQDKDDYALSRSSTSGTSGSTDISQRSAATTSTAQSGVDSLMDSFCASQADTIASASAKAPAVSTNVPKENGIHVTNDDDNDDGVDDGADAITDSSFPSGAGHRRRRIRRSLANRINDDDDEAWFLNW